MGALYLVVYPATVGAYTENLSLRVARQHSMRFMRSQTKGAACLGLRLWVLLRTLRGRLGLLSSSSRFWWDCRYRLCTTSTLIEGGGILPSWQRKMCRM